jgi:hypothetical protein
VNTQTAAAIRASEVGADEQWEFACMHAIGVACARWDTFTSEDVNDLIDLMNVTTPEPRAMGAMMLRARKIGMCEPTGEFVPSHRTKSNTYSKRVWRAL